MTRFTSIRSRIRAAAPAVAAFAALGLVAGCSSLNLGSGPSATASTGQDTMQTAFEDARRLSAEFEKNPDDLTTGFRLASALKKIGSHARALEILAEVARRHPDNRDAVSTYGKALAEAGRGAEASEVLARAQQLGEPDWRIHMAQGMAHDQAERYADAQAEYAAAAALAPNEPSIYNNWGLSFALSGDLAAAEEKLTKAAGMPGADEKVRANLALVLGLQGRFDEAERIAAMDLTPDAAKANSSYLRELLRQPNSWEMLRNNGGAA